MSLKEVHKTEKKKPIINYIKVSYNGDQSVDPVDILRSREGYNAFLRDRKAIPMKIRSDK